MSGGSYDYLCYNTELADLLNRGEALAAMRDRLSQLPGAEDAAAETEQLIALLHGMVIRVEARAKRLAPVWKAVEWRDSSDWGDEQVQQALTEWREGQA